MTDKFVQKQLTKIAKKEEKFLQPKEPKASWKQLTDKVEEKIPDGLQEKLELAFYKGFQLVFEKGSSLIEKTYDKEDLVKEHQMYHYSFTELNRKKSYRKLKQQSNLRQLMNLGITTLEGAGLGLLGIGLPDIPIFIGVLLKGIYEKALSYGIDYEKTEEQYFILLLIEAALAEEEVKMAKNQKVDEAILTLQQGLKWTEEELAVQMKQTAQVLATDMLCLKFIQGLPVVGVVGGAANVIYDKKILDYADMKYQKRYLLKLR